MGKFKVIFSQFADGGVKGEGMKLWDNFWLAICAWLVGVNLGLGQISGKAIQSFGTVLFATIQVAIITTFAEKLAIYVYNILLRGIRNINFRVTHLYFNRISIKFDFFSTKTVDYKVYLLNITISMS
jgi:hypothetical protein